MKHLKILLCGAMCLCSNKAKSEIIVNEKINHISDILQYLPLEGETIAALDWDDTLSKSNRSYEFRDEGPGGTFDTLSKLQEAGVKTFILTSRLQGLSLEGGIFNENHVSAETLRRNLDESVGNMLKALGPNWANNGPLQQNEVQEMVIEEELSDDKAPLYAIMTNQIVFAGGQSIKGRTLAQLIDGNKFKTSPVNLFFVDDGDFNIDNVAKFFATRPERVYLFHYAKK